MRSRSMAKVFCSPTGRGDRSATNSLSVETALKINSCSRFVIYAKKSGFTRFLPAHKGLRGGSRLATKIFQIMLLNEAETSTELN